MGASLVAQTVKNPPTVQEMWIQPLGWEDPLDKILQARHQQYVNRELPDVQAAFRKGRGTRDQIANTQ